MAPFAISRPTFLPIIPRPALQHSAVHIAEDRIQAPISDAAGSMPLLLSELHQLRVCPASHHLFPYILPSTHAFGVRSATTPRIRVK